MTSPAATDAPRPSDRSAPLTTTYAPALPMSLTLTLSALGRGRGDPTQAADGTGVWRTSATPDGPATLRLEQAASGAVTATAWGPGADWVLAGVPELLGRNDSDTTFAPEHPLLVALHRRYSRLRVPRSRLVFETLVPSVLEQKVTGREARRSFRQLVLAHGSTPPGPTPVGMRVSPTAQQWRRVPSWDWHRAGVGPKRSRTILAAAMVASTLERTVDLDTERAATVLRSVPGIGAWTAAEIAQRALGDTDAVSVGDFHIPAMVGWALLGRPIDDPEMLDLLEPVRPHRYRAIRLLEIGGPAKPRFAPRLTPQDHRRH